MVDRPRGVVGNLCRRRFHACLRPRSVVSWKHPYTTDRGLSQFSAVRGAKWDCPLRARVP
jgi:hypothetical protein